MWGGGSLRRSRGRWGQPITANSKGSACVRSRALPDFAGAWHEGALVRVLVELVTQGADRDAEDVRGVGAVAEDVVERFEDEVALDIGDGAPNHRAGNGFGDLRGLRCEIGGAHDVGEARTI